MSSLNITPRLFYWVYLQYLLFGNQKIVLFLLEVKYAILQLLKDSRHIFDLLTALNSWNKLLENVNH